MLLRTDPHMPVTPFAELSQFLHLVVHMLLVVLYGQTPRIEDAHVAAKAEQDPSGFVCKKTRVRS